MTDTPRSPTPPRGVAGNLARGLFTVGLGVAAYLAFGFADGWLRQQFLAEPPSGLIEVVELPSTPQSAGSASADSPTEGPGNGLLRRAVIALDRGDSLTAKIRQHGWLDGQAVTLSGDYLQTGAGAKRRFVMRLAGELAGSPAQLLRVSDSRHLWTDLSWLDDPAHPVREVSRVDLRHVRRALSELGPTDPLAIDPNAWTRFGGLPTLLLGLEGGFSFGQPRRMQLRQETVLAMVGRPRGRTSAPPARGPHHVVIALAERTLMPLLVEYRSVSDALSAHGLADESVLTPSRRPLLKIEVAVAAQAPQEPDPRLFVYRPNEEGWVDETQRELRLIASRGESPDRL